MISRRTALSGALAGALAGLFARPAFAQSAGFDAAADYSEARRGVSMLVMERGEIIFERYANGGSVARGWNLASGTKSFTGIIAAALAQDGLMDINEPVSDTISAWRADAQKRLITISQLLSLTSGLQSSGVTARPPTYADALDTPSEHAPGAVFEYGPTPFQIFGEVVRRKIEPEADPLHYLQRRILDPIGIAPSAWRRGADGMPHMPQGAEFAARAWAAFGQCVMEGGRGLVDQRVLRACFQGTTANPGYGLSWWLLRSGLVPPNPRAGLADLSELPTEDVRMAAGAGDQRLYLIPSRNLVIVRQAELTLRSLRASGSDRLNDAVFLRLAAGI